MRVHIGACGNCVMVCECILCREGIVEEWSSRRNVCIVAKKALGRCLCPPFIDSLFYVNTVKFCLDTLSGFHYVQMRLHILLSVTFIVTKMMNIVIYFLVKFSEMCAAF
jgi:hypothetical protein